MRNVGSKRRHVIRVIHSIDKTGKLLSDSDQYHSHPLLHLTLKMSAAAASVISLAARLSFSFAADASSSSASSSSAISLVVATKFGSHRHSRILASHTPRVSVAGGAAAHTDESTLKTDNDDAQDAGGETSPELIRRARVCGFSLLNLACAEVSFVLFLEF